MGIADCVMVADIYVNLKMIVLMTINDLVYLYGFVNACFTSIRSSFCFGNC